jgi:DNA-binding MarR family transcriptional regulator
MYIDQNNVQYSHLAHYSYILFYLYAFCKLTVSINKMHIDKIEYMNNELSDYIERYFGQYTFPLISFFQ